MQMYTMELCHPRRLAKAYKSYSREIILEIDKNRGFFELKRTKMTPKKPLWYQDTKNELPFRKSVPAVHFPNFSVYSYIF